MAVESGSRARPAKKRRVVSRFRSARSDSRTILRTSPPEHIVGVIVAERRIALTQHWRPKVLPPGIGKHENHGRAVEPLSPLEGRVHYGPGRRADEQALPGRDLANGAKGAVRCDDDLAVQERQVEDGWHKAIFHAPQALQL